MKQAETCTLLRILLINTGDWKWGPKSHLKTMSQCLYIALAAMTTVCTDKFMGYISYITFRCPLLGVW